MKEPNWSCEWCGARYYRHPCWIRDGIKTCCSRRCGALNKGRVHYTERFWKYVQKTEGCWLWTGCLQGKGYGQISDWDGTTKTDLAAHRVSYEIHHGKPPDGLFVLHKCDNPACVNPEHLFLGTNQDNIDDMVNKQRNRRGTAHHNARLTEEIVAEIRLRHAAGESRKDLASEFGVSPTTLTDLFLGRTWQHVTA